MDNLEYINIDSFKKSYYKALLPLMSINDFLSTFEAKEIDSATQTLISLFDITLTKIILANMSTLEDKQEFLRLAQEDYDNQEILEFLAEKLPHAQDLISQALDRTLLSARKAIL